MVAWSLTAGVAVWSLCTASDTAAGQYGTEDVWGAGLSGGGGGRETYLACRWVDLHYCLVTGITFLFLSPLFLPTPLLLPGERYKTFRGEAQDLVLGHTATPLSGEHLHPCTAVLFLMGKTHLISVAAQYNSNTVITLSVCYRVSFYICRSSSDTHSTVYPQTNIFRQADSITNQSPIIFLYGWLLYIVSLSSSSADHVTHYFLCLVREAKTRGITATQTVSLTRQHQTLEFSNCFTLWVTT